MTREEALGLSNGTPVEIRFVGAGAGTVLSGVVHSVYQDGSAVSIRLNYPRWGIKWGVPSDIVHLPQRADQKEEENHVN
jgi:hypothetical protein